MIKKIRNAIIKFNPFQSYMQKRFNYIYQNNVWGSSETRSGHGSEKQNSENLARALPNIVSRYSIRSILDVPCGDVNWMPFDELASCTYTGADIVPKLIKENKTRYPRLSFLHLDIVSEVPPCADLVICRDLLVHLPLEFCRAAFRNIVNSGARYILVTTYNNDQNVDIDAAEWRELNLLMPPFSFMQPLELIEDQGPSSGDQDSDKFMGLWQVSDLSTLSCLS